MTDFRQVKGLSNLPGRDILRFNLPCPASGCWTKRRNDNNDPRSFRHHAH
jgi:hypothetical protein